MRPPAAVQWTIRVMAGFLTLAAAAPAYGQSCPMCYNAAAATKASAIQALRSGTLILIFPVLFLFVGMLFVVFRSRNRFNEAEAEAGMNPALAASKTGDLGDWARAIDLDGALRFSGADAGLKPGTTPERELSKRPAQ